MKCLIVYYSQNGTTERVSEAISGGLCRAGYQVETHNLKDGKPPELSSYDLLGIGTPVYYYRMPVIISNYINNLPQLNGLPVFLFLLHGPHPFDTSAEMKKAILKKGALEAGFFHCYGTGVFFGYIKQGVLFTPDHPNQEELKRAEDFGYEIGSKVYRPVEKGDPPPFIFRLERFFMNRWLVTNLYSRLFIRTKKCTACGRCALGCPTKNISRDAEGRPKWGRSCELCLTCEMNCPQEAIISPVSWPLFYPFLRYNVGQGLKSKYAYAKVVHYKGKIKRI